MSYEPRRIAHSQEIGVRGLRYRLTWWNGRGDTPPVLLLHGFMDSGETWQLLVDCLPESWSCVAPDWRGFGRSERSTGGYWFPEYLADLESLLDVLVPNGRARVIGHSMGGHIAALYAGVRPRRLAWLANLEGLGPPRTPPDRAPERYAEWLDQLREEPSPTRYESAARLASVLLVRNSRLTRPTAELIAQAWTRPEGSGVELAADPRHRLANPVLARREEAEACWRRVEIPVLLVMGERSERRAQLGADASDEYFRSMFRDVRIATIPGAGHMLHHENPEAVAQLVRELAMEAEALPTVPRDA